MKKILLIIIAIILVTGSVEAADYSFIRGGSYGYMSTTYLVVTYFYGQAGETLYVISDKTGLACAIGGMTSGYQIATKENGTFNVPSDDLYMLMCARGYGAGYTAIGVTTMP